MAIDMKIVEEMVADYKAGVKLTQKFQESLEGKFEAGSLTEVQVAMAIHMFRLLDKSMGQAIKTIEIISKIEESGLDTSKVKEMKKFLEKHRSALDDHLELIDGSYIVPLKNDNSHSYTLNKPVMVSNSGGQICKSPSGAEGNSITTTRGYIRPATSVEIATFIASKFCNKLIKELGASEKKEDYLKAFVEELASKSKK